MSTKVNLPPRRGFVPVQPEGSSFSAIVSKSLPMRDRAGKQITVYVGVMEPGTEIYLMNDDGETLTDNPVDVSGNEFLLPTHAELSATLDQIFITLKKPFGTRVTFVYIGKRPRPDGQAVHKWECFID